MSYKTLCTWHVMVKKPNVVEHTNVSIIYKTLCTLHVIAEGIIIRQKLFNAVDLIFLLINIAHCTSLLQSISKAHRLL